MTRTYPAILRGDRLEWIGESPAHIAEEGGVKVQVMILDEASPADDRERGRRLADLLRALAEMDPFAEITDPVAWQREIREDRPLPGRE
jgi:hypothetical protein